jgi:hypothetical protein
MLSNGIANQVSEKHHLLLSDELFSVDQASRHLDATAPVDTTRPARRGIVTGLTRSMDSKDLTQHEGQAEA